MEDSKSLVERTKNKFYETKNLVDAKLGDHLNRSRSLLSDVNSSLKKSTSEESSHSQRYFPEAFVPFKSTSTIDSFRPDNSDPLRCNTRMVSPTYLSKKNSALGMSETPRHVTQATWILKTSHVTCNLSNNQVEDEQEKTPEILLKDPADLLKGESVIETKYEDKLTELLRDKSFEKAETKDVPAGSKSSMSYDIVSSLDLPKRTLNNKNVYGSSEFVNSFLNNSYNDLESLTQMLGSNNANLSNPSNFYNNFSKNCDDTKNRLSQLNEMFTEEFVNNSGVDFNEQLDTLATTLLKLNEQDKLKEIELAPKVMVNEESQKKVNEPRKVEFKQTPRISKDATSGLETDLLGSFTIIRDDRTGRKMCRLSDFDKKFRTSGKSSSSVEVQTESYSKEPEPVVKKHSTNVKVVYRNSNEGNVLTSRADDLKKHDVYAQKLLSNLKSKLEMRLEDDEGEYLSDDGEQKQSRERDIFDEVKEYNDRIAIKEREKMSRWRAQREPIYDLMNYNLKLGIRNSTMCRGGRRNTRILHSSRPRNTINENVDQLYYISPSNRKIVENDDYYGYDFTEEDLVNGNRSNNKTVATNQYDSTMNYDNDDSAGDFDIEVDDKDEFDPIDNFDNWWRANTKELNMFRDKLTTQSKLML
ncbi:hypothetical protein MACK_000642 [Theileria orientalis]|uniref:Uncharacterized protein n=1 Tax=Theileria orientalis TaxID=68886 RepID=A0A976MA89_THEOR|nr:hypothetical protein MACK_000642 [Theileria orientalis]